MKMSKADKKNKSIDIDQKKLQKNILDKIKILYEYYERISYQTTKLL